MEIFKEFSIEAAHWLPNVPDGHKCRRMHGHSFHVSIHVEGMVDPRIGLGHGFRGAKGGICSNRRRDRSSLSE